MNTSYPTPPASDVRRPDVASGRPAPTPTDDDALLRALLREAYPAPRHAEAPEAPEAEADRFAQRVVRRLPPRRGLALRLLDGLTSPFALWVVVGIVLTLLRRPVFDAAEALFSSLLRLEMPSPNLLYTIVAALATYAFLLFETFRDIERR